MARRRTMAATLRDPTRHTRSHPVTGRPGNQLYTTGDLLNGSRRRGRRPARLTSQQPPQQLVQQRPQLPNEAPAQPTAQTPINLISMLARSYGIQSTLVSFLGERDYCNLRSVNHEMAALFPHYDPTLPWKPAEGHAACRYINKHCMSEVPSLHRFARRAGWNRSQPFARAYFFTRDPPTGRQCRHDTTKQQIRACQGSTTGWNVRNPHLDDGHWVCRKCVTDAYTTFNTRIWDTQRIVPLCRACSTLFWNTTPLVCQCRTEFDDRLDPWLCLECKKESYYQDRLELWQTMNGTLTLRVPVDVFDADPYNMDNWVLVQGPNRNHCLCGADYGQIIASHWPHRVVDASMTPHRWDFPGIYRFCLSCDHHVPLRKVPHHARHDVII